MVDHTCPEPKSHQLTSADAKQFETNRFLAVRIAGIQRIMRR
jgi:hypothetical protein